MTATASQQVVSATHNARQRFVTRRAWLLAGLAFLPLAIIRSGVLYQADTFWQIRTGELIIAHHAIPATDTFSWTMHGKPFFLNSWGFNVLLAVAYRLANLPGVAILSALITMGVVAMVLRLAHTLGASPTTAAITLILAVPLLAGWLSARPQLADYAAALALFTLLRRIEKGRGRWETAVLAGLVTVIWINLHTAALLSVAIAVAGAVMLLAHRNPSWHYTAAAAVATAAGCLLNPYGVHVLYQADQVQADSAQHISEWAHVDPSSPLQDLTLIAGLSALILAWRHQEIVLMAALVVCLAGTVEAVRFLPFVVILAVPTLAAFAWNPPTPVRRYLNDRRVMFRRCGALGLVALFATAAPSLTHIGRPDATTYPAALVARIPYGCRLFTSDGLGGYVILARPDVPVSLDGRNNLYGPALESREVLLLHGYGNLSSGLAGAGCVLVPRSYGLAQRLRNDPQWRVQAADPIAILYLRRAGRSA